HDPFRDRPAEVIAVATKAIFARVGAKIDDVIRRMLIEAFDDLLLRKHHDFGRHLHDERDRTFPPGQVIDHHALRDDGDSLSLRQLREPLDDSIHGLSVARDIKSIAAGSNLCRLESYDTMLV